MIKDTFALRVLYVDTRSGKAQPAIYTIDSTGKHWLHDGEPLTFRRFTVLAGWGEFDGPAVVLGVEGWPWEIALPALTPPHPTRRTP